MWAPEVSTLTASAVFSPPTPIGPMPERLSASFSSLSSRAKSGRGLGRSIGRQAATVAMRAVSSIGPPMPTPIISGGQGFAPARKMESTTNFFTPTSPAEGGSTVKVAQKPARSFSAK